MRIVVVGPDDRRTALLHHFGEEAKLGRQIGVHRAMIVEMIVAEVGEGRRLHRQTFGAILVEAVARRLERRVRHTLGGETRHRAAERRVGKECVRTGGSRWSPYQKKKKKKQ